VLWPVPGKGAQRLLPQPVCCGVHGASGERLPGNNTTPPLRLLKSLGMARQAFSRVSSGLFSSEKAPEMLTWRVPRGFPAQGIGGREEDMTFTAP